MGDLVVAGDVYYQDDSGEWVYLGQGGWPRESYDKKQDAEPDDE